MHGNNVVVVRCVLGVPGAGQFELLRCVGELEGGVRVGRVRQQGALPLQQLGHPLEKLPEPEGQGGLAQAVQLLTGPREEQQQRLNSERLDKSSCRTAHLPNIPYRRSGFYLAVFSRSSGSSAHQSVDGETVHNIT